MTKMHSTCVVHPQAQLGHNVVVGPFCVIEQDVEIGDGCQLESHVVIKRGTRLGRHNYVAENAVLGGLPQHKSPPRESGRLIVGHDNVIREHVTVHRGMGGDGVTRIGNHNLIMVGVHIAHDCELADHVILANNVMLAGHIGVGDRAYLSGAVAVHQFCRIGSLAMVGGQAHITKDVPPFVTIDGLSSGVVGLNLVGLRRAGFDRHQIGQLKEAYRVAFRDGLGWQQVLDTLRDSYPEGPAAELCQFLSQTQRGCVRERTPSRNAALLKLHRPEQHSTRRAA